MRKALVQHVQKNSASYAPAFLPIVFFLLAHVSTLVVRLLQQDQVVCKTIVTWAVYGFLPLLLCSYGAFYLVARPMVGVLERKFSYWSGTVQNLGVGVTYGAAIGIALALPLNKSVPLWGTLLLLVIGMAVGQGNWFFYRRLMSGLSLSTDTAG